MTLIIITLIIIIKKTILNKHYNNFSVSVFKSTSLSREVTTNGVAYKSRHESNIKENKNDEKEQTLCMSVCVC